MLALCRELSKLEDGILSPEYSVEQKFDGERLALTIKDQISGQNRRGNARLPVKMVVDSAKIMREHINEGWVFDGELVRNHYIIFDLLEMPKFGSMRQVPWIERRQILDKLVPCADGTNIHFTEWYVDPEEKENFVKYMIDSCVEGVVFKKIDSTYPIGRAHTWKKHKFVKTAEAIVMELNRKGKAQAMTLGMYNDAGQIQTVGGCRILPGFTLACGDVVEVRYLYGSTGQKLYQPVLMRKREDKTPDECVISQIVSPNKSLATVMES